MSRKEKLEPEVKLELVERYLKGEISQSQASNKAEVDSHSFRDWLIKKIKRYLTFAIYKCNIFLSTGGRLIF